MSNIQRRYLVLSTFIVVAASIAVSIVLFYSKEKIAGQKSDFKVSDAEREGTVSVASSTRPGSISGVKISTNTGQLSNSSASVVITKTKPVVAVSKPGKTVPKINQNKPSSSPSSNAPTNSNNANIPVAAGQANVSNGGSSSGNVAPTSSSGVTISAGGQINPNGTTTSNSLASPSPVRPPIAGVGGPVPASGGIGGSAPAPGTSPGTTPGGTNTTTNGGTPPTSTGGVVVAVPVIPGIIMTSTPTTSPSPFPLPIVVGSTGTIGTINLPPINATNTIPSSSSKAPRIGSCQIFPSDNPWNTDITNYPVVPNSDTYITSINNSGSRDHLHPDFGGNGQYGMPLNIVNGTQPKVPINFIAYGSQSDPGPYPIPRDAKVQTGDDHHVIVLDKDNCKLYELFNAEKNSDDSWNADSGAVFDLTSNKLRPNFWTSADAAGLAIYPGVIKYEEVARGEINHAIRFTVPKTQRGFIHPATHYASNSTDPALPPMGMRIRLKADYDISKFPYQAKVILTAMKKYGMILADNGSAWAFGGEKHLGWNTDLRDLKKVPGNAFEVIKTGEIIKR